MVPRLHVPGPHRVGAEIGFATQQSHYLRRVLRLGAGDPVQVFDGQGARFATRLVAAQDRQCRAVVEALEPALPESPLRITLAQCLSSGEKMDWTIEKAVELGVAAIVPILSVRSVVRLDEQRERRRMEHWHRLIVAACMQCGRDRLPDLCAPVGLGAWLASPGANACRLVLSPDARTRLGTLADPGPDVELLVGPESGLGQDELALALSAGFSAVSIGPRVLRTETAGLAAVAALQARFGDL